MCSKEVVEDRDEQAEFESGPLSVLMQSVKQNTQVLCITIHDTGSVIIVRILYFMIHVDSDQLQK
jgi:hypothetical protein